MFTLMHRSSRGGAVRRGAVLLAFAVFLGAVPAYGEVASAILTEGGTFTGIPAGHSINSLNNTAVNHAGGYAVAVNTTDGVTTLSHVWGHATGGAGQLIRTEGTFGPLMQTSFESFYGISNTAQVAYSASGTGGPVGSFDSVWLDDTPVAVEGDPIPTLPGQFWRFASRPGSSAGGDPYWVGGTTSVPGGSTENYGLFYGVGATVVLLGGMAVPGLPFALGTSSSVDFDYRYSAQGTHYIAPVKMASGSTTTDDAIVVDGAGLMLGGALVREGAAVPPAIGGLAGENWGTFGLMGINEGGRFIFSGNTSAATGVDEIVVANGSILYREGQVLDGQTITGAIEGAALNEDGDTALVWDVDPVLALEALFVNDQLVLLEGDAVDLDNDGIVEPGSILRDFTGISALTMSDRNVSGNVFVYFTADVDTAGTTSTTDDVEGFFRLEAETPGTVSVASSTGPAIRMLQGAPNPSSGPLRVQYELARPSTVNLSVFDIAGRLVARLEAGRKEAGRYERLWSGRDAAGNRVAAGTYFVRLHDGERAVSEKILFMP